MNILMFIWMLAAAVLLLNSNAQVNGAPILFDDSDDNVGDFMSEEHFLVRSLKRAAVEETISDEDKLLMMNAVNTLLDDDLASKLERVLGTMNEEDRLIAFAMTSFVLIDTSRSCDFYEKVIAKIDGLSDAIESGVVPSEYNKLAKQLSENDQQIMNSVFARIKESESQVCALFGS